jgi:hypothetical protein
VFGREWGKKKKKSKISDFQLTTLSMLELALRARYLLLPGLGKHHSL